MDNPASEADKHSAWVRTQAPVLRPTDRGGAARVEKGQRIVRGPGLGMHLCLFSHRSSGILHFIAATHCANIRKRVYARALSLSLYLSLPLSFGNIY